MSVSVCSVLEPCEFSVHELRLFMDRNVQGRMCPVLLCTIIVL